MNKSQKIVLLLLACINFTHILDFMIMMPLGNYLMPYFNITTQQFSLLVAAYTLSAGISGFVAAFFVDQYDRKKVLLFGYIGFLVGTIACGIAPSYQLLLAARLLAGTFGGLIGAQVLAIVSDMFVLYAARPGYGCGNVFICYRLYIRCSICPLPGKYIFMACAVYIGWFVRYYCGSAYLQIYTSY